MSRSLSCLISRLAGSLGGGILALMAPAVSAQDLELVTFGGATPTGNYTAIARNVCEAFDAVGRPERRCSPESTAGSIYNLFAMRDGELDFALVQSDWQRQAVEGTGPFAKSGAMNGLRSVMSLYQEAVTLVVRRDADISSWDDLEGKVVDLGHPTTARRGTIDQLVNWLDLPDDYFGKVRTLSGTTVVNEICTGNVDAVFVVFGHPSGVVRDSLARCDLALVSLDGPKIAEFLDANPGFSPYTIPQGTYPGMTGPIETFSVSATLVTRAEIADDTVALMTGTILESYDRLREAVPVLPALSIPQMQETGLSAPLHPGAAQAFSALGG